MQERCVWMARKMTEWPSKRGPITKIMPSDGCIGDTVPLAVGKWYDFHEFGWYMGNVGHITGGGRGRHVGPRQVGIDIQVEFGRASLDTAQHKVFDGVVADRTQAQGVLHRAVKHLEIEGLHKPKDLDVFPLAGLAHARLQETAQGWEGIRQFPSG